MRRHSGPASSRQGAVTIPLLLALLEGVAPLTAATLRVDAAHPRCQAAAPPVAPDRDAARETVVCSLLEALQAANADPEADRIELGPGSLHRLAAVNHRREGGNGLPAVTGTVVVEGRGAVVERSPAPGTPIFRLLRVEAGGDLTLRDLTLRRGATEPGYDGAAVWNRGRLTLEGCALEGNYSGDDGGAVRNDGTLVAIDSVFRGNQARGRGGTGGALYNVAIGGPGTARLKRCALVDNEAGSSGGAVWNEGELVAVNTTLSDNRAIWGGGGLHNNGRALLHHVTVATNRASVIGGGVRAQGPVELVHSLLAGNESPIGPDCEGSLYATDRNWIENPSDCPAAGDEVSIGPDTGLGPLDDYGGPTPTHALLPGSSVRDAARPWSEGCPEDDQRGEPRPAGSGASATARCDLGAYEAR